MRSSNPPVSCISIPNEFHFSFFLLRNQKGKMKQNAAKAFWGLYGSLRLHSFRSPISFRPFSSVPFPVGVDEIFFFFFFFFFLLPTQRPGMRGLSSMDCGRIERERQLPRCADHFLLRLRLLGTFFFFQHFVSGRPPPCPCLSVASQ